MNIPVTQSEVRLSERRRFWRFALLVVLAILSSRTVSLGQSADSGDAKQSAKPDIVASTPGLSAESRSASPDAEPTGSGAQPQEHENTHTDPVAPVLLGIVIIILAARLGGHFFELAGQPSVLGELIVGVALGNLSLLGISQLDFLKVDWAQQNVLVLHNVLHCAGVTIDHLARIGVILLLFQVGLETSVAEMRRVGSSALLVAVLGVVTPMGLGWGAGMLLLPEHHWAVHMFLGATLAATSVGITARVLKDLGKSTSKEAQIILGAAVIDDVLGLVVLAAAQGIISAISATANGAGGEFGIAELAIILVKAVGFLAASLFLGQFISRPFFKFASFLRGKGLLVVSALAICFTFAWTANAVGLAPIVGAFAAGLILEEVHYRELTGRKGEHELEELIKPIADFLVPIFFVMMGFHVDLRSFADPSVLGLAFALTAAAIVGKQVCAFGVLDKGADRRSVGLGMIPRGEVGLIFAAIGLQLRIGQERIVDPHTYSALVVMVIITTMITPPLLKWSLKARESGRDR